MFEWLEKEIASVGTPRFHVVDGPADPKLQEVVTNTVLPVPVAYQEFVLRFGNAKLYRQSRCGYTIGVLAEPRTVTLDGATAYRIGFHDCNSVYVVSRDGPIFEGGARDEHVAAADFRKWLSATCAAVRKGYPRDRWSQIVRGPAPFSNVETRIVEARKRFKWRVIEIDTLGYYVIEVANQSGQTLPVLTIGARSKNGRLNGSVRLDVSSVEPGESHRLRVACYKDVCPPREIELFSLRDPQPEDREYYAEFGVGS